MLLLSVIATSILCILPSIVWFKYRHYDRLISYIPAFCTSVGILFTFFVLFLTLGVNIDNVDLTGVDSIQNLIKELSSKFSSSLVGILGSIIWSLIIRIDESKKEAQQRAANPWKNTHPQELLWNISQQQLQMIAINREIIETNAKNNNKLINTVTKSSGEIRSDMEVVTEMILASQNELREEISSFRSTVGHSIMGLLADYEKLIKQLVENLSTQTITAFSHSIESISSSLKELTNQLVESHRQSLDKGFEGIVGEFEVLKDSLANLTSDIVKQTDTMRENSVENGKLIQEQFNASTKELVAVNQDNAINFNKVIVEIRDNITGMGESIQSSFQEILERNADKVQDAFDKLEDGQVRLSSLLESTTHEFAEAVREYHNVQGANEGVLLSIANQNIILGELQRVAEFHLNNWKLQLTEMKRLIDNVDDIATAIDQLQNLNDTLSRFNAKIS